MINKRVWFIGDYSVVINENGFVDKIGVWIFRLLDFWIVRWEMVSGQWERGFYWMVCFIYAKSGDFA